jgi:hypothetical protein
VITNADGPERRDDAIHDTPRRQHFLEKEPSNQRRKNDTRLSDSGNGARRSQAKGRDHDAAGQKRDQFATQSL